MKKLKHSGGGKNIVFTYYKFQKVINISEKKLFNKKTSNLTFFRSFSNFRIFLLYKRSRDTKFGYVFTERLRLEKNLKNVLFGQIDKSILAKIKLRYPFFC